MKEIKGEGVDLFLSNGTYDELQKRFHEYNEDADANEEIATYLSGKVDDLFRENKKFQKYIEIYSELAGLKGFALLEAEGDDLACFDEGYWDGKRIKRVQGWIDKHDGKYACLFLRVSGIGDYRVESANSLLFIPDQGISDRIASLFSPIHRHIDMNAIDYYLKEIAELRGLSLDKIIAAIKEKRCKEWMRVSERIGGCSK